MVSTSPSLSEPKCLIDALQNPDWLTTMHEELKALEQNNTWVLVPRTPDMNVIGCKWIFKVKLKSDGSIERYKAMLVAQGYSQVSGMILMKYLVLSSNQQQLELYYLLLP